MATFRYLFIVISNCVSRSRVTRDEARVVVRRPLHYYRQDLRKPERAGRRQPDDARAPESGIDKHSWFAASSSRNSSRAPEHEVLG